MQGLLSVCVLWLACAACNGKHVWPSAPGPFELDPDSDAELTRLSPKLAEGRYVYGVYFMLPRGSLTDAVDVERVAVAPRPGGLQVTVGSGTVETDLRGNYVASPDGTGSAETVQRLTLPAGPLDAASRWARAAGEPLYTPAELRAVDASGLPKTKTVVDHSRVLGVKQLADGTSLVAIKRDLRSYVLPSQVAMREGTARAAAGFTTERPGTNEQRGAAYAFFAVLPSSEAVLLVEASILFPSPGAIPRSLEPYLVGRTPGIAWVRELDVRDAGVPPALRSALEHAMLALPDSPRQLYLDGSRGGVIAASTCVHCGGV